MRGFCATVCIGWNFAWLMPGGSPLMNGCILAGAIVSGIAAVVLAIAEAVQQ